MLHSSVILADVWRDITPLALRTYLWQRRYVEFDRLENFRIATKSVLVCKFNTSFFTLASSVSLSSRFHRLYQQSTLFFPLNGCLFFFPSYMATVALLACIHSTLFRPRDCLLSGQYLNFLLQRLALLAFSFLVCV